MRKTRVKWIQRRVMKGAPLGPDGKPTAPTKRAMRRAKRMYGRLRAAGLAFQ
jgi:hypothetical protein